MVAVIGVFRTCDVFKSTSKYGRFAVCSVLREEGEEVIARLVERAPDDAVSLELSPFDASPARELTDGGSTLRLLPHVHGTDGYFAASFTARR